MNDENTYTAAFEELQTLVAEIEQGTISVDELASKVKRAAKLIEVCKVKLHATEAEVNQVLADLADTDAPASESTPTADA